MGLTILLSATLAIHSPLIAAQSPASQQAIRLLGERNQAAIDKIKTLTCSYRTEDVIPPQLGPNTYVEFPVSGQYFRKGRDFYSTRHWPTGTYRHWDITLVRQDRIFSLYLQEKAPSPSRSQVRPIEPNEDCESCAPWDRFLIRHLGPRYPSLDTFRELIAQPHLILCYRHVVEDNASLEYVKLKHKNGTVEFWFDPGWNSWVRKSTSSYLPDNQSIRDIIAVARSHDGAIIPTIIEKRFYTGGRLVGHARTVLSDVQLNGPFQFTGLNGATLEGSICEDLNRNIRYRIDAMGNRTGPETVILQPLTSNEMLYPFDLNGDKPIKGTQDTLSNTDWAVFSVVVASVVAGIGWLIRTHRPHSSG